MRKRESLERLDDDIRDHIERETEDNIARGLSPEDARSKALRTFGNIAMTKEDTRAVWIPVWLDQLVQDVRYGARGLRRNPGFTLVAVLTLALGIGANTAVFRLVDAVRLQPLPVKDPQQLVEIRISDMTGGRSGNFAGRRPFLTNALWEQIRDRQEGLAGVFAWGANPFDLSASGEARFAQGLWVSGEFFHVLGVSPLLGRLLTSVDDRRGCASPGAVVSYGFWQREYGGDRAAIGRRLRLDGRPVEVIGVTPPDFDGVEIGRTFDVALPICAEALINGDQSSLNSRTNWWLAAMGRLKPGWSIPQASAQLAAISPSVFRATVAPSLIPSIATRYQAFTLQAVPAATGVSTGVREQYGAPLWLLLLITTVVLVIACVNIANLLLAQASAREHEMAVRLAIGASRLRIIRQLLAESALLAAFGAALGVALAQVFGGALTGLLNIRRFSMMAIALPLRPDWRVLAFSVGVTAVTCLLFGLTPAVRAARTAPHAAMKARGFGSAGRGGQFGLGRVLVVAQVALSLTLVVAALLFVRTFRNLTTVDAGFQTDGVLLLTVDLQHASSTAEGQRALGTEILERIRAVPAVQSAAVVRFAPVTGSSSTGSVIVDGVVQKTQPYFNWVSPSYFHTMQMPLIAGRDFADHDDLEAQRIAIVNQTFARQFLDTENPVGRVFQRQVGPGQPQPLIEIVGLVRDSKYNDLREDFPPIAFFPDAQQRRPPSFSSVVVRTRVIDAGLTASVSHAIADVNSSIVVYITTLRSETRDSLILERLMALLSAFFGVLAAALAAIGLYGVISYAVTKRTSEIGVRMALGAETRAILLMILRDAFRVLGWGIALGALLALAAGRASSALLFGVQPYDPLTMAAAMVLLAVIAVVAASLPAARAARIQPALALRNE
jgi:putative ABC transport system permease protein